MKKWIVYKKLWYDDNTTYHHHRIDIYLQIRKTTQAKKITYLIACNTQEKARHTVDALKKAIDIL